MGLNGEWSSNSFFHVEERSSKNERKRERTKEQPKSSLAVINNFVLKPAN